MAVLIPGKLLYLATPHTGSIATTHAMVTLPDARTTGLSGLEPTIALSHHATREEATPFLTGTEIVITTVRNPYDLVVTWWVRQRPAAEMYLGKDVTFEKFVCNIDKVVGPQYIRNGTMFWQDVDQVMHYETLEADLDALLLQRGLPPVKIPSKNVTAGKKPWRQYHTKKTLAAVKERFKQEIEQYNY